jgi:hypothetical protein
MGTGGRLSVGPAWQEWLSVGFPGPDRLGAGTKDRRGLVDRLHVRLPRRNRLTGDGIRVRRWRWRPWRLGRAQRVRLSRRRLGPRHRRSLLDAAASHPAP